MLWNKVTVTEQRQNFIRDYRPGYCTISNLAESFAISRNTAYRWIGRWEHHGAEGSSDHSRRPRSSPWQTPETIRKELPAVRGDKPPWQAAAKPPSEAFLPGPDGCRVGRDARPGRRRGGRERQIDSKIRCPLRDWPHAKSLWEVI